jgi:hypothetical protein
MKKKDKKPRQPAKEKKVNTDKGFILSPLQQDFIAIGLFTVILLILYNSIIFRGYIYEGGDTIETLTKTSKINEYYQKTGEVPLWNPYPEAGTPNLFHLPKSAFSIDFYLEKIGDIISMPLLFFLLGAIGMYYLLKYLRFSSLVSFTSSLVFILTPYYKSLIIVGQYLPTKFEAIMVIPWIVLTFLFCLDKMKLLYLCLFSLALSIQFQTQHYQVIYYTALLLFAIGVYPLLMELIQKRYFDFLKKVFLLLLAVLFSVLSVAFPLFLSKKYNEFSMRAKWAIDISKEKTSEKRESGVDLDFVKSWSLEPREFLDFLIPRASGGTMSEKYDGSGVPELKGKIVPSYWGNMLLSGSLMYLGIPVLLSLMALFYFRNRLVISLSITALILSLWALGLSFTPFYMFFYDYLPFFKNFRTPPTSLNVVYFILALLSAYGLKFLLNNENLENKVFKKKVLYILAAFFVFGLIFFFLGDHFRFNKPKENFDDDFVAMLQKIRSEFYFQDLTRYFVILSIFSLISLGFIFKLIKQNLALLLICALIAIDLIAIQSRHTDEPISQLELKRKYFPSNSLTDFFNADKENYRVYSLNQSGMTYTSAVQTIDDSYDLQTMINVSDLFKNNLYHTNNQRDFINWNVVKIFAVKYLIFDKNISEPLLTPVFSNPENNEYVYIYKDYLPFGHFVKKYKVIEDDYDRLKAINDSTFDPAITALLEKEPAVNIQSPDSSYSKTTVFTPNKVQFEVYSNKPGLFVISVPYLPDGWKVYVDDKLANNVLAANHAMQSVIVPEGIHSVSLEFKPGLYKTSVYVSAVSSVFLYLMIASLAFIPVKLKKRFHFPDWLY